MIKNKITVTQSVKAVTMAMRSLFLVAALFSVLALCPPATFAADGDLDGGFGIGGKRTTDFLGNDDIAAAVAVQPDGKIVTAGPVLLFDDTADFGVARYNSDGSPDTSFGTGGKTTTDFFGDVDVAFGVAIQPSDGKIVVVGLAARFVTDHYETFFALARYNTDGSLDNSFGTGGRVTNDVLGINIHQSVTVIFVQAATGIAIQLDNKIVVAGGIVLAEAAPPSFPAPLSNFGIARFNTNGTLDTSFNGSGRVQRDFFGRDDVATSVAIQPDQKIVAAGFATKNTSPFDRDFAWVRYNSNGSQDTSIGSFGRVTTDFIGGSDGANALAIQSDGKILLGGFSDRTSAGGSVDMAFVRYHADASLDTTFDGDGKLTVDFFTRYDEAFGITVQPDGRIIAVGGATTSSLVGDFALVRLLSNGALDSSFGVGGKQTTDFNSGDDFATAITMQADGKLVVSGGATVGSFTDFAVVRYQNALSAPLPVIQLSSASFSASEGAGQIEVTVTRSGNTAGPSSVKFATSDTAGSQGCAVTNGTASARCDYLLKIGTLEFVSGETVRTIAIPVVDDGYAEGGENFSITLSNPAGATLGSQISATLTINDNDSSNGANPIDNSTFFVRQHYLDFLNREPDAAGLAFWVGEIENCTPKPQCTEVKRINVSAAFFVSIEFTETGFLVYRFYKSAFGNIPNAPVPVRFEEFLPDTQRIGEGIVVNQGNWQAELEARKNIFALEFVSRSRFAAAHPTSLTPAAFVDALYANGGVNSPPAVERTAAINEFGGAANTADTPARARALRRVAENSTLFDQERNRAFVLMQYYGYLRRNPFDPPEPTLDYTGYNFWLTKLNQFNGNYIEAEMVKAFITSIEYRQRFAP